MPVKQLKEFLDQHHVKYVVMTHSPAFTAMEIAQAAHVSGKQLVKTVIVSLDGRMAMVMVPANDKINFAKLCEVLSVVDANLASEMEFKNKFPGCEVGAMPPFGNLYDMPVFASSQLSKQDHVLFNAGSHSEVMQMMWHDFERLVKPKVVAI